MVVGVCCVIGLRFRVVRCRIGGLLGVGCWGRRVGRGRLATGRRVCLLLHISSIGMRSLGLVQPTSYSRLCSGCVGRCVLLVVLLRSRCSVSRWWLGLRR